MAEKTIFHYFPTRLSSIFFRVHSQLRRDERAEPVRLPGVGEREEPHDVALAGVVPDGGGGVAVVAGGGGGGRRGRQDRQEEEGQPRHPREEEWVSRGGGKETESRNFFFVRSRKFFVCEKRRGRKRASD